MASLQRVSRTGWWAMVAFMLQVPSVRAAEPDPWFGHDKALHFSACAGLGALGYGAASPWLFRSYQRALIGGGLAVGVGALKEAYDAAGYGDPSARDFAWDVIGAVVGVGVGYGLDVLFAGRSGREPRAYVDGALWRF